MPKKTQTLQIDGHEVTISSPDRVVFPKLGITKLDLVNYYQAVGPGALRGIHNRPMILKRFVKGISQKPFFQKQAPKKVPDFVRTATLPYASGHKAVEVVADNLAALLYVINLGCVDLNPHPIRADDLEHPDELRVDLDPMPGVGWPEITQVAALTHQLLVEHGLIGWPKTSGSRGIHILVRIERQWTFAQVRRAAQAIARAIEERAPAGMATARWWKEERKGVFVDFNQNAYDRTVASAYSVRPTADARVSTPLSWSEVSKCDPGDFTLFTVPKRFEIQGDPHQEIDEAKPGSLESLLELADILDDRHGPLKRPKDGSGRRVSSKPLIIIAQSPDHEACLAGLDRWKERYAAVVSHLEPQDVLIDSMRGRSSTWTRVRINLEHVPKDLRPEQQTPDPDEDPLRDFKS